MHISQLTPLDSFLAISYRNHQKRVAYFSHLAPLVLFLCTKRQSQTLLRTVFKQWEALGSLITLIGRAKIVFTSSDVPVFTENFSILKSKKKVYTSSDVLFSAESIGEEKKRSSLFVMRPPFSPTLGFSLLSLYARLSPVHTKKWASCCCENEIAGYQNVRRFLFFPLEIGEDQKIEVKTKK